MEGDRSLATVFPEGLPDMLCLAISAKALGSNTEGGHHRLYINVDGIDGFLLVLDHVDPLVLGELVGTSISQAPYRRRRDGSHEVGVG